MGRRSFAALGVPANIELLLLLYKKIKKKQTEHRGSDQKQEPSIENRKRKKKKSTALCGNWNWKSERVPLRSKMEEGKWPLRKRVEEPFMSLRVLCSAR